MALKKEGVVCLNVIAFTNIICCSNKRCLQILPCQCQRSTRDWYIGNIKRCVCKVLRSIKLQVELRMLKRKKSLLPAKEVAYVIFLQNESCFRSSKPHSCAWFSPLSFFIAIYPTLPCPLPNAADAGMWTSRALALGKLCLPTSRLGHA